MCRPSTPTNTALSGPGIRAKGPRRDIEASAVKKQPQNRKCTEENIDDKEVYHHSYENKKIQNGRDVFVPEDVWSGDKRQSGHHYLRILHNITLSPNVDMFGGWNLLI